jgi:hypothetical protein
MLFAILYARRPGVTDGEMRRGQKLFMAWEPPHGLTIRFHYIFARGGRGLAIVDAADAGLIREATAPFSWFLEFEVEPVLSAPEALAISQQVNDWADSV